MAFYYNALICRNGHCISSRLAPNQIDVDNFCEVCGGEVFSTCPECRAFIRGSDYDIPPDKDLYRAPSYCYRCGKPYPWTQTALDGATEMIMEDESLEPEIKRRLIISLPDMLIETPRTQLAVSRFKRAFPNASYVTADGLINFLKDYGSPYAIKLLGSIIE